MDRDQVEAATTHIPDWSQFATKADLEGALKDLKGELIRWMALLLAAPLLLALIGGLVTLSLR